LSASGAQRTLIVFHLVLLTLEKLLNLITEWCKEVQCSVMSKLEQIKISSLKSLIAAWNTKKLCKALVDTPIRFLITQNKLKMWKILERGTEIFCQNV
jgi:hypothetical protein